MARGDAVEPATDFGAGGRVVRAQRELSIGEPGPIDE